MEAISRRISVQNRSAELTFQAITADQANVGSYFTADKIASKIRHVYGGDAVDHRGVVGGIV